MEEAVEEACGAEMASSKGVFFPPSDPVVEGGSMFFLSKDQMFGRAERVITAPSVRLASAKAMRKGKAKRVRIVHVSDTHLKHGEIEVPECDILVHSGDFSTRLGPGEVERVVADFVAWMEAAPAKHRVFVCGNHECALGSLTRSEIQSLLGESIVYLQDSGVTLEGIRFWGHPWTRASSSYSFGTNDAGMAAAAKRIPKKIDVLISHMPPYNIMDLAWVGGNRGKNCALCGGSSHPGKDHWGCPHLLRRVLKTKARVHLFGHVHDSTGIRVQSGVLFSNASYDLSHPVHVIDIYV